MHQDLNFGSSFGNSSLLEKQGNFLEMRACVAISIREAGFFCVFFKYLFIYLFTAALGPHCCMWALSSCRERGPLSPAVRELLIAVAPPVAEHGLQVRGPQ